MLSRFIFLVIFLAVSPAAGFSQQDCLSDDEARSEVQSKKLITLQQALTAARVKTKGDLISAHLCRLQDGLQYRISIIGRDGRVARLLVDATSGHVLN